MIELDHGTTRLWGIIVHNVHGSGTFGLGSCESYKVGWTLESETPKKTYTASKTNQLFG